MSVTVITADHRDNGQTLGAVLKARLNLSWSKAKQTIERRHVRVAGQIVADAAYRVKAGKRITIAAGAISKPATASTPKAKIVKKAASPRKENIAKHFAVDVVYSDDAVVVLNKPTGLTTNRSAEEKAEFGEGKRFLPKTLADLVPALIREPGVKVIAVHRIDRDTSGLVVFAKTTAAAKELSKQFKAHTVERRYQALVRGTPQGGRIESTFVENRGDNRRGSGIDGVRAVTNVTVLKVSNGFALVQCRLETGRTHQVRIHLGEAGTPLCGETVYDRPVHGAPLPDTSGAKRPMLHAAVLGFIHPSTGERLRFEVEPPSDFDDVKQRIMP